MKTACHIVKQRVFFDGGAGVHPEKLESVPEPGDYDEFWAAGLDPDVNVAKPSIPWCCDMGGRETLKRNCQSGGVRETEAMCRRTDSATSSYSARGNERGVK